MIDLDMKYKVINEAKGRESVQIAIMFLTQVCAILL